MEPTNAQTSHADTGNGNGHASYEAPTTRLPTTSVPPEPAAATSLEAVPPAPSAAAGAPPPAPHTHSPAPAVHAAPASGGERCSSCGAAVAADQRYCLECGQRRGEPRLPFMDASSMMETAAQRRQPPAAAPTPPRKKGGRVSANTALIAGVGTLLLALGIGVLIGRSGEHNNTQAAAAPQIIKVGGGGGEVEASSSSAGGKTAASKGKSGGGGKAQAKAASKTGSSGQSVAAEEVLKPSANAKPLPPPETKVGGTCKEGTAGCEGGKFSGNFFE
jgi:hypothetical protein